MSFEGNVLAAVAAKRLASKARSKAPPPPPGTSASGKLRPDLRPGLKPCDDGGEGLSKVLPTSTRELQRVCSDEQLTMGKLRKALDRVPHDRIQKKLGTKCAVGCTPLHYLCSNPRVTAPMISAVHDFHPETAAEKDKVRARAAAACRRRSPLRVCFERRAARVRPPARLYRTGTRRCTGSA